MELLCIQTHSQGAVKAGNPYPLVSDKSPCKCRLYNVGVRCKRHWKGKTVECRDCGKIHKSDGYWWLHPSLFAPIATDNEIKEKLYSHE